MCVVRKCIFFCCREWSERFTGHKVTVITLFITAIRRRIHLECKSLGLLNQIFYFIFSQAHLTFRRVTLFILHSLFFFCAVANGCASQLKKGNVSVDIYEHIWCCKRLLEFMVSDCKYRQEWLQGVPWEKGCRSKIFKLKATEKKRESERWNNFVYFEWLINILGCLFGRLEEPWMQIFLNLFNYENWIFGEFMFFKWHLG